MHGLPICPLLSGGPPRATHLPCMRMCLLHYVFCSICSTNVCHVSPCICMHTSPCISWPHAPPTGWLSVQRTVAVCMQSTYMYTCVCLPHAEAVCMQGMDMCTCVCLPHRVAAHPVLGSSEALMLWLTHGAEDVARSCAAWSQMLGARKQGG